MAAVDGGDGYDFEELLEAFAGGQEHRARLSLDGEGALEVPWPGPGEVITLNALVFTLLYRVLPKVTVSWRNALQGGLVAAVIWEVGRQLLAAFVIGQRYTSAYGVIGSLLAIMLWGYYSVAVVFVGAEFIQVISAKPEAAPATP